jgi:hypothetical protein
MSRRSRPRGRGHRRGTRLNAGGTHLILGEIEEGALQEVVVPAGGEALAADTALAAISLLEHGDGQAAEPGQVLRAVVVGEAAAVLVGARSRVAADSCSDTNRA